MTAQTARIMTRGSWIARDGKAWIVGVPVAGGHKIFEFDVHGGNAKAYEKAKNFHAKKESQLRKEQAYYNKNGEKIKHVRSDNNTGIEGINRHVYPTLQGRANIVYYVTYVRTLKGIFCAKSFSTYAYIDEKTAFEAAKKQRATWERNHGK